MSRAKKDKLTNDLYEYKPRFEPARKVRFEKNCEEVLEFMRIHDDEINDLTLRRVLGIVATT